MSQTAHKAWLPPENLARAKREAFHRWLIETPPEPFEIVRGSLTKSKQIALDLAGLEARGWRHGLPERWEVRPGDPIEVGGYDEDRPIYTSAAYGSPFPAEARTRHLGLDIFAPAYEGVFCPLPGTIHSFKDNRAFKDYGPTIILEHKVGAELVFHTLYGHLARTSFLGMTIGQSVRRGDRLGWLGDADENGSWPPHLHFQIVLEIGDWFGDYPGVCRNSERDRWLLNSPSPMDLLLPVHLSQVG